MYDNEYTDDGDESLYDENSREESLDNDEIDAAEEAFMKGYDDDASDEKEESEEEESDEEI